MTSSTLETAQQPAEPDTDLVSLLAMVPPRGRAGVQLQETMRSALGALRVNKGRSVLTTLGISIGVAAVIVIVTLAEGASATVAIQVGRLGTNLLTITPGSTQSGGVRTGAGSSQTLTADDAAAIAQRVDGAMAVSPVLVGGAQLVAGNQNWPTRVQAVTPDYLGIENWEIGQGVAFTDQANATAANVAVLGQTVVSNLFPTGHSPIGQLIRIRNVPFTVIGVLSPKGTGLGGDLDDTALIPFRTGQVRLFGGTSVNEIVVQVDDPAGLAGASKEMSTLLHQRHRLDPAQPDDFTIRNNSDILASVDNIGAIMTVLLGGVAAISLVVGGIGIMNIMLVSVTERTSEIGIRLAVGAQPSDVLAQFLAEAVLLSLLGGTIGIGVGVSLSMALPLVAHRAGAVANLPILTGWPILLPWSTIVMAFCVSAPIGIFFGIYPARRASRLDPIVALRYE